MWEEAGAPTENPHKKVPVGVWTRTLLLCGESADHYITIQSDKMTQDNLNQFSGKVHSESGILRVQIHSQVKSNILKMEANFTLSIKMFDWVSNHYMVLEYSCVCSSLLPQRMDQMWRTIFQHPSVWTNGTLMGWTDSGKAFNLKDF